MNNHLSYCGLVVAKISASEKDLSVPSLKKLFLNLQVFFFLATTEDRVSYMGSGLILVTTGNHGTSGAFLDESYVFNFTDPSAICDFPKYPKKLSYATGDVVDNELMICGGSGIGGCSQACYKYDLATNAWIYLVDLPSNHKTCGWAYSTPLNGALWFAGLGFLTNFKPILFLYKLLSYHC